MSASRGASALAAALLASGCATIMLTPHKSFALRSIPDGARFEVREAGHPDRIVREGTTPVPLYLERGFCCFLPARYTIALAKEGYAARSLALEPRVSGWYWLNIVFLPLGGLFGLVVDPIDGAMWELEAPPPVELEPSASE